MMTIQKNITSKGRFDLLSVPGDVWKYVGIFFGILLLSTFTFDLMKSFYISTFLKPVSFLGYYVLRLIGLPVTLSAETLPLGYLDYILPDQILEVNFGCTGIYVLFVFIAAILAYPAHYRSKIIGVLIGIPLFMLYSAVRLVIMGIIGNWLPQYLTIMHNYLMVVINIAFMLWLYALWVNHAVQKNRS